MNIEFKMIALWNDACDFGPNLGTSTFKRYLDRWSGVPTNYYIQEVNCLDQVELLGFDNEA